LPISLTLLLGVSGAATAQDAGTPAPQQTPAASAAPAEATLATPIANAAPAAPAAGSIGAPPEGKGQIVFYREKKFTGAAIRFKVREGETELGKLSNGVYFVVPVDPGTHTYTVHSEAKDVLTLDVEPGETYYVKGSVSMGFM